MCKFMLTLLLIAAQLNAQQVITAQGEVRLNWSQLQLEFSGTGYGTAWAKLEELAWRQGFQHLKQVMPHIYAQHYPAAGDAAVQQAAERVFQASAVAGRRFFLVTAGCGWFLIAHWRTFSPFPPCWIATHSCRKHAILV